MKYLYYYIWITLGYLHVQTTRLLILPIVRVVLYIGKKTEEDYAIWKKNYNKANLVFPGGINDWFAYGMTAGLFLIPVMIVTFRYKIDIYTGDNKWYFIGIAALIGGFCYYWIYFRNIDWLKKRINKVSKKYYLK